ncbi:radical SAM protein [bacterium]|nr:MAG: radical SAM protein [bacterium]
MKTQQNKQIQKEKAATKEKHWVRLTKVCNNNCLFCLDKDAQDGTAVSLVEIKKNLLKGRKKKIDQVVLSGGEATIHPDFLKVVEAAKSMGYRHIQVITNGRMFAYPNFLISALNAGVNEITFSIHGHNEKLHDAQTQINGSFQQAIKGLKNALSTNGLIVNVDIVINKINYIHLADILKYFVDLGVREFDLLQIIPSGQAWKNRKKLFYDIPGAMPHIRRALAFSRDPQIFIWTNRFPPAYLDGFEDLIQHPKKLYDEIKGRQDMFEDFVSQGKVMRCWGEKCYFCFLKNFCQDLASFKNKGELFSKELPLCLHKKISNKSRKIIKKSDKIDVFQFLDFFISGRYFVKGIKCEKFCSLFSKCDGMQIDYIRKNGFKSLVPIEKITGV